MNVRIEELNSANEKKYESLLAEVPESLLYHSLPYRNFLKQILNNAKDRYLLAFKDEKLVGAIPAFVKYGNCGAVINSLPFFGSPGSFILTKDCTNEITQKLFHAFDLICQEEAITSTIIENPLYQDEAIFNDYNPDFIDERIGQITPLPSYASGQEIENHLMTSFHGKTRNLVRKGKKSGFNITHDDSEKAMRQLHALHDLNMKAIGGLAKSWAVFQAIRENFTYDKHYRVYTAKKGGQLAAGLLVFFFNQTAEYFTPVIHQQYRSDQPLSYLIFLAMKDAVVKGCEWWNWGGTWLSQGSVYHFKSRWGTKNHRYKYLIKAHSDLNEIKKRSVSEILAMYPYFYILPFSEIVGNE